MNSSPPPYFSTPPDLWIPIPNTSHGLPLTWQHTKAVRKLARFFARLYSSEQRTPGQANIDKYQSWMTTLFQMDTSIREGFHFLSITDDRDRAGK
jgi:hypothetical protein